MGEINLGKVVGPQGQRGEIGPIGPQGEQGEPGRGIPYGGLPGQQLIKKSGTDYETEWGGYPSNPNLLDNWYFVEPINQRGQTEYTDLGYTIDRWKIQSNNSSISVQSDGIIFEYTGSSNGVFRIPFIAKEAGLIPGTIVTLSFLAKVESISSSYINIQLDNDVRQSWLGKGNPVTIGEAKLYSCTVTIPDIYQSGDTVRATIYSNHSAVKVRLYAAKLELGDKQTLAHQDATGNWVLNDPPPNKALELLKCQRYFQRNSIIRPKNTDSDFVYADLKVPMRAVPTITNISTDPVGVELITTASKDAVRLRSSTGTYFEVISFDADANL